MKWLAFAALAAAFPALAEAPSSFRSTAPITVTSKDALQRVALPMEAYRDARPDLADVRVYNGRGESVPIAWAGDPGVTRSAAAPIDLPLFPVSRLEAPARGAPAEVTVRTSDGTLVAIRGKGGVASRTKQTPAAYLLDASRTEEPVQALVFEWKAGPGAEVVPVRVEASEDLRDWVRIGDGPLVRVENAGRLLSQPRVEFAPRRVKYLRVTSPATGFEAVKVSAEFEPRGKAPPRHTSTATAAPGPAAGEYLFDLGARLPVEALRVIPSQPNAVLSTTLFARNTPDEAWRLVASAPFYRLTREGGEVQSPPIEIGRRPARYWMVRLAAGSSPGAPTLEAQWKSADLVFVMQGEGPYRLAFGNATATKTALPISNLVPTRPSATPAGLGEAVVGAVRTGPPPTRWVRMVGEVNPRRLALWGILLAGVGLLAWMAWRLSRQMRAGAPGR